MMLDHLNFFNKVINKFLTVEVKIDKEDKALILLCLLPQSNDYIITIMLYGKKTLILKEVMTTLLPNEIRKKSNKEEQEGSGLVVTRRKGRGEGKFGHVEGMSLLSQ